LTDAIAKNANYKKEAKIDLEFVNFKASDRFLEITK
jgi:hypothetical protein